MNTMLICYVYAVYSSLLRPKKKQNPLCINYNNPTSREKAKKKIHAEIKAERPNVIMCQKIKKQLPHPLNGARYVKHTVVLL